MEIGDLSYRSSMILQTTPFVKGVASLACETKKTEVLDRSLIPGPFPFLSFSLYSVNKRQLKNNREDL